MYNMATLALPHPNELPAGFESTLFGCSAVMAATLAALAGEVLQTFRLPHRVSSTPAARLFRLTATPG